MSRSSGTPVFGFLIFCFICCVLFAPCTIQFSDSFGVLHTPRFGESITFLAIGGAPFAGGFAILLSVYRIKPALRHVLAHIFAFFVWGFHARRLTIPKRKVNPYFRFGCSLDGFCFLLLSAFTGVCSGVGMAASIAALAPIAIGSWTVPAIGGATPPGGCT